MDNDPGATAAPEKNCPAASRRRKTLQTSGHKAYSEYSRFTHKVPTRYPQPLALQTPPYRIILYRDRDEPLDIGVRAKSLKKVNPQNHRIFRLNLRWFQQPNRSCGGDRGKPCQGLVRAWVNQASLALISNGFRQPGTFDFGQGAASHCPYS